MRPLTVKQQRFVEAYSGNASAAAIQAGYSMKTARSMGQRLLTNVDIQKAIQAREVQRMKSMIMTREERQEFWTSTIADTEHPIQARLKASELLGRSEGDFLERVESVSTVRLSAAECEVMALQAKIDLERIRAERGEQNGIPQENLYVQPV
jgi:phage terminase small subunit